MAVAASADGSVCGMMVDTTLCFGAYLEALKSIHKSGDKDERIQRKGFQVLGLP